MCNPIRIFVEYGVAEIAHLEFVVSVDDRFHAIFLFYKSQPREHALLKLFVGLRLSLMLHVEHRRQVALFEFYLFDEIFGLCPARRMYAPEVVSSSYKAIFACLIKVVVEFVIQFAGTFCGLNHHKAYGTFLYHPVVAQFLPVYLALVMADVDAVNLISFRIGYVAI